MQVHTLPPPLSVSKGREENKGVRPCSRCFCVNFQPYLPGDSISDEEDLLTTEIVPKWDELPEIPAPSYERADVESNKEFFIENFECLGSTPTEDKEEPLFQSGSEAALDEPLPFERNSFHRTSISARFIQRSKQSSVRLDILSCLYYV